MLVIRRTVDEEIRIGDDIRIVLVQSGTGFAKIGIEAPPGVPIHRQEIYEKVKRGEGRRVTGSPASNAGSTDATATTPV